MMTYEEALNLISERTIENRQESRQKNLQRRTTPMDMYGVEIHKETKNGKVVFYSPSLSADKEYLERLQFKIVVEGSSGLTDFKLLMGDTDDVTYSDEAQNVPDDEAEEIADVDLSPYLAAQHGVWVDGNGIFPTSVISDKAEVADFYDILEACGDYIANTSKGTKERLRAEEEVDMMTSAGLKRLTIETNTDCSISILMYVKYSQVNR